MKILKRIRYFKIVHDILYIYILCAGMFSFDYVYEIINKGVLPEEYYSPAFFIATTNHLAIAFIVFHFCVVSLEIFILKKYRYLKPEVLFTIRLNEDGELLDSIDIEQVCADLRANEEGYIEGGDGFILIDRAIEIIREAAK